ncbi:MAG TPA: DUF4870 domain-containing protein [Acidobacteriaceae bacterium]|jgi:uncharacterized membrane protein
MSDQYGDVNTGATPPVGDPSTTPGGYYGAPQPPYSQPGYTDPYAQQQAAAGSGLSDNAAGALAYVTIIPAIIFLVMAPYNQKPFVKFHAFQCLGLAILWFCLGVIGIIPILGWIIFFVGMLAVVVLWVICVVKASQGGAFKLPVIGNFAAQQSGYQI